MASGIATVKAVLSGDTLVLMGAPKNNGPPPELMLTLSSLQAPKLARSSEQTSEPYAWASREFLRKLVIGKQVRFKVEYRVTQINRDFGSVWIKNDEKEQEENVCVLVAKAGFAKVKTLEQSRDGACCDLEKMLMLEQTAITEKKGMYQDANEQSNITLQYTNDGDFLLAQYKGKLIPAIIEHVRDGSSMRVVLRTSKMESINFGLAGVQCPRMGGGTSTTNSTTIEGPAPFACEAKHFTETRLLHRDVEVKLLGVDKYGNLYGSIVHKSGKNISIELLKNGLGKMVDWSSVYLSDTVRSALRNAEKEAKDAKLRLWKNYEPPVLQSEDTFFHAQVIEILSGDCLIVFLPEKQIEKRIYLSSLRAPRIGNSKRQEPNAPWALESKEFLRSLTIGKNVRVQIEYERTNPETHQLMTFASVFLVETSKNLKKTTKKKNTTTTTQIDDKEQATGTNTNNTHNNIAMDLIQAGLAEVIRHRSEEEKSSFYDELLAFETKAQQQKKGIHSSSSKKEIPSIERRVIDLCFDPTKAKQFLPFLKRNPTSTNNTFCKAIVEQVYAGNRLKMFIPKENCLIHFMIAGIKCPQTKRYTSTGMLSQEAEEFGEEAKLFTKRNVMQRDVLVEIEDMDRGGNAFGSLYVSPNGFYHHGSTTIKKEEKNNFGCILLSEGLAYVDQYSIERTNTSTSLKNAEEQAKKAKKNLWKNYQQQQKEEELATMTSTKLNLNNQDDIIFPYVKVSEILNGTHFFLQTNTTSNSCSTTKFSKDQALSVMNQLEEQMKAFTKLHGIQGKTFELKKNAICAALFDDGNGPVWNRAKIEHIDTNKNIRVRFVDYGNVTTLGPNKLRPLDSNLINVPPQAKECVLGFIKQISPSDEFGHDAAMMLSEMAWGQILSARVHGVDENNNLRVTLYNSAKQNLTEKILEAGIIRVDRKQCVAASNHQKQLVDTLIQAQNAAKKKRKCLWRYGDIESDEDL